MLATVSVVVLADLIDELYTSDKNPLGVTHKRGYREHRNDYGDQGQRRADAVQRRHGAGRDDG